MAAVVPVLLDARGRDCRGTFRGPMDGRSVLPLFYVYDDETRRGIHRRAKSAQAALKAATTPRAGPAGRRITLIESRADHIGKRALQLFLAYLGHASGRSRSTCP